MNDKFSDKYQHSAPAGADTMENEFDKGTGLDSLAQKRIGKELKSIYDEVVNEPIPDDMLDLLDRLAGEENSFS